ncbi:MAG: hypothetical protein AAGA55_01505 [Planctomycetota bacterium]
MPVNLILSSLLASSFAAALPAFEPAPGAVPPEPAPFEIPEHFNTARELLEALAKRDEQIDVLTGDVRLTAIQALQGDTQRRYGNLALKTVRARDADAPAPHRRLYAVRFTRLQIDARVQDIQEHYIFDGRWFVERHPEERQFIKREVVPAGQTLDPMDLMRDAPFWVSVGDDADIILKDYQAALFDAEAGIAGDPELEDLARFVPGTIQLKLEPRAGAPGEDDWESVRMWFDKQTLLPRLYVKTEWTGDRQIAELFSVQTNTEIGEAVFDTTTPDASSGWQVHVSPWRGRADG